jgi:hypothetical protein
VIAFFRLIVFHLLCPAMVPSRSHAGSLSLGR